MTRTDTTTTDTTTDTAAERPSQLAVCVALAVQAGVLPVLAGPPGGGKTSLLRAVAAALGFRFLTLRPASCEAADLSGYPVPDLAAGRLRFLPGSWYGRAVGDGTPCVVLLDEIYACAPSQSAAVGSLTFDRLAGDETVPPHVLFVAAGNPPSISGGGSDVGSEMTAMLANRVCILDAPPVTEAEFARGLRSGWAPPDVPRVDPVALARELRTVELALADYHVARPGRVHAVPTTAEAQARPWPSPRSWSLAARAIAAARVAHAPGAAATLAAGLVGADDAGAFLGYLTTLDLPDPAAVLAGRAAVPLDRADRTRVTLEAAVQLACERAAAEPAERERWIDAGVAVVAAVVDAGRADLVGRAQTLLQRACPGERYTPALRALALRTEGTLARGVGDGVTDASTRAGRVR